MRKAVPILLLAVVGLLLLGVTGGLYVYHALHQPPLFYEQELARDPASQQEFSDRFLQQSLTLASDMQAKKPWRVVFTADEINGWLAVDVPKNYPDAIPPELSNPRVVIDDESLTVGFHLNSKGIEGVVTVSVDVFVCAPDEIAICFKRASLGSLPLPLGKLIDTLAQAAEQLDLRLIWRQQNGYPVAIITLPQERSDSHATQLEAIILSKGEMLIAGRSEKNERNLAEQAGDEAEAEVATVQSAAAKKENRQR